MKIKVTKKKIALVIILIIMLITMPTFARYVYNNIRDMYLKSRNFSFSSDFLTNSGKTYKYANWSGVDNYEIDFQLYSYENELSLFTYEGAGLGYTLTCSTTNIDKATVHIGSTSGEAEVSDHYIPNETNIKDEKIYLKPQGSLVPGDVITVNVIATTTKPFKKTLKATFEIKVTETRISYEIEDVPQRIYATLNLLNAQNTDQKLKLSFNPEFVMIDTTDELYLSRVTQTTKVVDEVEYIDSVTITLGAEDFKKIKFYKKDKSKDYTYPNQSGEDMVITITTITD